MSEYVICEKENLTAIANAVRASTGSTETFNVSELSTATINTIASGGAIPDVSGQIAEHNTTPDAHQDIRDAIPTKTSDLTNDSGFLTQHQSLAGYAKTSDITSHNTNTSAHNDIRLLVDELSTRLNALANSDDTTLDQMSEIVAYIKNNKSLIDGVTTGKINVSDIINNLTTNVTNKPLSAAQGVALKALIDAIVVPTKVSDLDNDVGYITGYTETDPTVPAWAKAASKPTYTASEVGALPLSGGTMTGEIKIGQGDGKGIQLGTNGRINGTVGTNTNATMFGISNGIYYLGHSGFNTTIRGSKTRPTYNGNDMALYSDVTSKMPNVAVTTSDNGKFLRVVNGAWAAAAIPNAEEATF